MALMGIDAGSSGCKAMVFSEEGQKICDEYIEYPSLKNPNEMDCNMLWESVQEIITKCAENTKEKITALSVSSFGESFVPVDSKGDVLMNAMLYTDKRGKDECLKLVEKTGKRRIMEITGVNPQPMYSLSKMMYIKDNHPDIYNRTDKFLLIASFIIYRLTGRAVIDYSLASRTMAFDITEKNWSEPLLEIAGIGREKFADIHPSGTEIGKILPGMASKLSLDNELCVVTGAHDQICAAIGAGVTDTSVAIDGTGTVECITPIFSSPLLTENFVGNNYACVPYVIEGMYATYAFSFTGGAILRWYKNNFGKHESIQARETGVNVYEILDKNASDKPTEIIVIPHFSGSATPDMNINSKGAFLGLTLDTSSSDIYRAMMEGVTYEMLYNLEILKENNVDFSELRAVGGGSKSPLWLQIKADITGKRIIPLETEESGIVGCVMLAGVATGVYKNLKEAVNVFVKKGKPYIPDKNNREIYTKNYTEYKRIRKFLSDYYEGGIK